MRLSPLFAVVSIALIAVTAQASLVPLAHLETATLAIFQSYTAKFESDFSNPFVDSGKLWIDDDSTARRRDFDAGKPVVLPRKNEDIDKGSIHHFTGAIRVPGAKIEQVRRIMTDYTNYPTYFKPDVARGVGILQPDSGPTAEHFKTHLFLTESTPFFDVAYDAQYDSWFRRLDDTRWISRSTTIAINELRDPHKPEVGLYPDGDDHGFLWRTNTYWYARFRDGGLDLQVDSVTLSRTAPLGFGWWGTKRTRDAVDKMLRDTKAAVLALK